MILFSHFRESQSVCYTVTLMAEMRRVSEVSDLSKALLFADGLSPPCGWGEWGEKGTYYCQRLGQEYVLAQSKPCIKVAWLVEMTEPHETKQWEAPWDTVLVEVCTVQPHGGQSDSVYQKCKCTNLSGQQCYV